MKKWIHVMLVAVLFLTMPVCIRAEEKAAGGESGQCKCKTLYKDLKLETGQIEQIMALREKYDREVKEIMEKRAADMTGLLTPDQQALWEKKKNALKEGKASFQGVIKEMALTEDQQSQILRIIRSERNLMQECMESYMQGLREVLGEKKLERFQEKCHAKKQEKQEK